MILFYCLTVVVVASFGLVAFLLMPHIEPERSMWMRGLLWAEQTGEARAWQFKTDRDATSEYDQGIIDYINYMVKLPKY